MACSVCQGAGIIDWMDYSTSCAETVGVYNGYVPGGIPSGVAVPAWAFTSPLIPPYQFDVAIAKAVTAPDSSSTSRPSSSTSPTEPPVAENGSSTSDAGGPTRSDSTSATSALPGGASSGSSTTTGTQQTKGSATISNSDGGFMTLSDPPPGSPTTSNAPQRGGNVGDAGSANQASERRNIGPIIGAVLGGTSSPTMPGAGMRPNNPPLQPFSVPREPPHYFSGYVPSEAGESESPPAYATEAGGLVSSGDGLESGRVMQLPLHGQSKFPRDLPRDTPVHAFSPVHKVALRR
ncbi:hypothetical protein FA13DRAFT_1733787 [Coprinellus micaceus]|uniref:Uncharacterized protein n=1 Tax=Coprinellus micaceus TaxID=71717 RepID=A0A4Y7T8G7_COPMI|nr:hypothetical protein FA13DRAFT_1733787 [Coprinellus micaceus]